MAQRKQNHSPLAPQGLGSPSHPSDLTSPGREARAGCQRGAHPKMLMPRCLPRGGSCLCAIPCRRDRENRETTRALPKTRRMWGLEAGMELGAMAEKQRGWPRKGDGRSNRSTAGHEPPLASLLTHVKPSRTWQAIFALHPLEKPRAA